MPVVLADAGAILQELKDAEEKMTMAGMATDGEFEYPIAETLNRAAALITLLVRG